ncbi:MAG TPA: hypothetical protein VHC90_16170 [Bryobacteraceae bacterium]|nr:hypothetical protein [Bryobacteraceae bacterium]
MAASAMQAGDFQTLAGAFLMLLTQKPALENRQKQKARRILSSGPSLQLNSG